MRTLLIVDDYEAVLSTLKWIIENRGYRTFTAKTGEAALALARSEAIDAALVDLNMPVMDGFEICRRLRTQAGVPAFPVWMMTGAYRAQAEVRAREIGARALLNKPFDTDSLLREIEAYWATPSPMADAKPTRAVI